MSPASIGDLVSVHYTGRLRDGTVFDSSRDGDPLEFRLGEGRVIPGFESAVEGMKKGDTVTAEIPATDAYGEKREDLLLRVSHDTFPEDLDPEMGDELEMRTPDGQSIRVRVVQRDDDAVTLDANHPLAGRDLVFDIELIAIG